MRATLLIASTVLVLAGLVVADARADEIEDIINQTTLDEYHSYLRVLTGVDPVPGDPPYYLEDRFSFGADIHVAAQWILEHFDSLGLVASLHEFDPGYGPNVIGELPGTTYPEDIYIYCAHYDTVQYSPGCDDNGSGTGAVMMAARILSQYEFTGTIRFIAFSGEEQGLVGSLAYAEAAQAAGENIVAVINLDMILHPGFDNQDPDPDYDLDIIGNYASQWLAQDLATAFETYTPIDFEAHNTTTGGSDHWAFWQYGYDAVWLAENTAQEIWGGSNDTYHQPSDTMDNPDWDWDFALHTVRGSMVGLALPAGLNCLDDHDCDGIPDGDDNCPYHWNPDQADCDDDGYGDVCTLAECEGQAWCEDCNGNGIPDGCDIADGTSDDYDLNAVPDECDPDCNANGVPDTCDVDCATGNCAGHPLGCGGSEDCNANGVADECDIASGTSADCQSNGVPDECDIAEGTSQDEDGDGIPDECEFDCLANELAKLLPSDGAPGDLFGYSVAISGDTAVIGAKYDDDNGTDSGSAYIFRYEGTAWVEEAKLLASDGAPGDMFSVSLAISGDIAVIGATYDDSGQESGSAYVFRYDGSSWVEEAKLLASDGADGHNFGYDVAISADVALIGAHHGGNGNNCGAAYVFRCDGSDWIEEAKLLASDGAPGDAFGKSVAVSGDTAVIGAWRDYDNGACTGSAYVFRFDGSVWGEEDKLLAPDGAEADCFGWSVAITGDTAAIGASLDDDNGSDSGSAYVFGRDDNGTPGDPSDDFWVERAKLLASDGAAGDQFGRSVAVSGDTAVIGAYHDDDSGEDSGSAYVFRFDGSGWLEEAKLAASDGAWRDFFDSVAVSADAAVIGAWGDDDNGADSGSVCVFRGLSDCNDNGTLDICDIADGTSEDANGNGVPDECEGCAGDVDGDGDTDLTDLAALLTAYGSFVGDPNYNPAADFDSDGDVDLTDLAFLLSDYGCLP